MKRIQGFAVCLAVLGLCFPQITMAAPQNGQTSVVSDVRLHESGSLLGQVVTAENQPMAGTKVVLLSGKKKLAEAKTDPKGYFAFKGLQNGVYQLASPKGSSAYRVWSATTAPPSAQLGALVIDNNDPLVRAQHRQGRHSGHLRNMLSNPWVVAAIIAAAVGIPVAVHNSHSTTVQAPSSPS